MTAILLAALLVLALTYVVVWMRAVLQQRRQESSRLAAEGGWPTTEHLVIGLVTDFLDTLGIGDFAPTTAIFRLRKLVPDELIPGTLNAGHSLPTVTEAFIYVTIVRVDLRTLALMIAAAVAGAWFGAGIIAGLPRRKIQIGMGLALFAAAALMLMTQLQLLPPGGDTPGLTGTRLATAVTGSPVLGALMPLGVGYYAPCLILVSLLGMNPKGAFPVMMGACAVLMPVASMRFVRRARYSLRPALGLCLGGIPRVPLAAFIVRALSLDAVRWLVILRSSMPGPSCWQRR